MLIINLPNAFTDPIPTHLIHCQLLDIYACIQKHLSFGSKLLTFLICCWFWFWWWWWCRWWWLWWWWWWCRWCWWCWWWCLLRLVQCPPSSVSGKVWNPLSGNSHFQSLYFCLFAFCVNHLFAFLSILDFLYLCIFELLYFVFLYFVYFCRDLNDVNHHHHNAQDLGLGDVCLPPNHPEAVRTPDLCDRFKKFEFSRFALFLLLFFAHFILVFSLFWALVFILNAFIVLWRLCKFSNINVCNKNVTFKGEL